MNGKQLFGIRLRAKREQMKMSQEELGTKLGLSKNAVSNYENGVSSPKESIMFKMFDVLKVDANYLFQDSFLTPKTITAKEQEYVDKYLNLDEYSQDFVNNAIDHEHNRQHFNYSNAAFDGKVDEDELNEVMKQVLEHERTNDS